MTHRDAFDSVIARKQNAPLIQFNFPQAMQATTLQALSTKARHRKRLIVRLRTACLFLIVGGMIFAVGRLIYVRKHAPEVYREPGWERKIELQRLLIEEKKKMNLPRKK